MTKVTNTQTFPITSNTTAAQIKTWLAKLPADTKISVSTGAGDWNYPDTHSLSATWVEDLHDSSW